MPTVKIRLGDESYELEVTHFQPGSHATRVDPGAGTDIEFGDTVEYETDGSNGFGRVSGRMSFDDFLDNYRAYHDLSHEQAQYALEQEASERMLEERGNGPDE